MRTYYIAIICAAFLFATTSKAGEGGFLKKKNTLTFDAYAPLVYGELGFEYTRVFTANFGVALSYRHLSKSGRTDDYGALPFLDKLIFPSGPEYTLNPHSYINSGKIIGLKLIFSSSHTGMQLPLGSYAGIGLDIIRNEFSERNLETRKRQEYIHKGSFLKLCYGKTAYLAKNFFFDITIDVGVKFGSVESVGLKNHKYPRNIYPYRGTASVVPFLETTETGYFTFGLVPHLKVGYLF